MQELHSAGVVLFRESEEGRQYLLLFTKTGVGLPKGRPEAGENDVQTALRETREETGITTIELISGFKQSVAYPLFDGKRRLHKTVTFFLGKTTEAKVTISWEHKGFKWCTFEEAIKTLRYKNQKELLRKAQEFLESR